MHILVKRLLKGLKERYSVSQLINAARISFVIRNKA